MLLGSVDSALRVLVRAPGGAFTPAATLRGHDNWIRGIAPLLWTPPGDAADDGDSGGREELLIATASQDRSVRLWRIALPRDAPLGLTEGGTADDLAAYLTSFATRHAFDIGGVRFEAAVSATLVGHEDWAHAVAWAPRVAAEAAEWERRRPPALLSASMDRTMLLWALDCGGGGIWMCDEAVGDAGAASLGYFSACFAPDASAIAANGYTGAIHVWRRTVADDAVAAAPPPPPRPPPLLPEPSVTGHWAGIVDLAWAADGGCLVTAAADQTVRVLGSRSEGLGGGRESGDHSRWYEIARPQVHGHDFHALAVVPQRAAWRYVYASASEEKVIRVFSAPLAFLRTLAELRGAALPTEAARGDESSAGAGAAGLLPLGAATPALGLSNKAVDEGEGGDAGEGGGLAGAGGGYGDGSDLAPRAAPAATRGQPLEEHLCQSTLWPEVHKLYGHGNDVFALAACPAGTSLVSASKAQSAAAAPLRVWDAAPAAAFAECQVLPGPTLTATRLAFSRCGRFLLSVSRDRSFCLFRALHIDADGPRGGEKPRYEGLGVRAKAHDRIIWAADWAPGARLFATGARDRLLRLWAFDPDAPALPGPPAVSAGPLQAAVTALAFAPRCLATGGHLLAVGLEGGTLELLRVRTHATGEPRDLAPVWQAPLGWRHAAAVRCVAFTATQDGRVLLASGGEDHTARVWELTL